MFQVNLWGSHPDEQNDDCWTGEDCPTREDAEIAFAKYKNDFDGQFVEMLENEVVVRIEPTNAPRTKKDTGEDWRHEIAMEAGMLHGIDAYNEVYGY